MMEDKICKGCGKIMKFEDYLLYNGYSEYYFKKRVWCSEKCRLKNCSKKQAERKKWNMELEHNQKIISANRIIKGEITGINNSCLSKPIPDIKKGDIFFEVEVLGHSTLQNKKEYSKLTNKKVLIISLRDELKSLFDEVYILDDIKKLV